MSARRIRQWLRSLVYPFWLLDAGKKYRWISTYLRPDMRILELGSGMGSVVQILRQRGFTVSAADIRDSSVHKSLAPTVYNGQRLPFEDGAFDVCLLLTVLHHCPDPDQVLAEAARVARQIVIIEDIYENAWQCRLTHWLDSLLNWEFRGHPHSNRDDKAWRDSFRSSGMQLLHASKRRVAGVFCQVTYVIRSPFQELNHESE